MNSLLQPLVATVFALATGIAHATDADLVAFVGQKLKVEQFKPPVCKNCLMLDSAFHAEYRVLKVVHGRHEAGTIRFDAFDHYGWPAFANHEHALLFVIRAKDGRLYHQKYQYVPVYETADGGWAGCRSAHPDSTPPGSDTPSPVSFKQPVVVQLRQLNPIEIESWRRSQDWELSGQQFICRMGVTLEELVEVKKLRARE